MKKLTELSAKLKGFCERQPRKAAIAALGIIVAFACGIIVAGLASQSWRIYEVRPVGVTATLPAPPVAVGGRGADGPIVYESLAANVATVLASFEAEPRLPGTTPPVIKKAMDYLSARPGVTDLNYQVTQKQIGGRLGWQVSGIFLRDGVRCRTVGQFADSGDRVAHVLCFFTDGKDGTKDAAKVLRSVRWGEGGR